MDDGDGMRVSPSSEVDHGSGLPSTDTEEIDSPKTPFPRDSGFSNNTPSIKMLNYNSINGDCVEKEVNQSEQSLVASSSNNSVFSESPDVTRDSLPEDVNRLDSESSSDNSSKSSGSELSEAQLNYSFSKSSDNSSPLHHSTSFASDSSSDSDDLSDSEEERSSSKDREERKRVDTPDTHSSQSFQHDLPKSSPLVSNECEKDHESAEHSQSDDSFKKKERSHPLFNTLDESITSESSTGDSIETPRPSLTSSVSQDVSLPLEEGSDTAIIQKDNDTVTESEEVADIQPILNENLDSGTIAKIPLPEEESNLLSGVLEENNSNSKNNIVEASQEIKDVSPLPKESNEPNLCVDDGSNSKTKNVDESIEKKIVESSQPGESLQDKEALISVKSDVNKPLTESSESEKNEELMGLTTTANDTSIVKPCTSSCFPNIDNTLNTGRRPGTDHKSNNENEFSKIAKTYSIKYKGFKKIGRVIHPKNYKKSFLRWNPFNPARKKDPKTGKYILQSVTDKKDSTSLQPEYAQYLGLQPIVKFKCSYCGMSNFQSMSALNTHKMECKRSVKKTQPLAVEKNKAITIRRRVYMCSVCGSYEPRSEVFQHMLEVHKLFLCLFDKCLKFCQSPEALMLHLRFDHKVVPKYCQTHEDFQKEIPHNFFLLCINCQKVFTELDDPSDHNCPPKPKPKAELISNTNDPYGSTNRVPFAGHLDPSSSKSWDIAKVTASLKLNKDITMKPVNDLQSSSSSQYRNSNSQAIVNNVSSESGQSMTVDNLPPDIMAKPTTENLNIKVPSDIEIKPVIPGEMHNQENKFEQSNESTIEIFPIPQAQPQKPKRTRTIIKKTIRKKIVRKKKKNVDNSVISNEINTSSEDSIVPPISPPIIAPPPIVRSPQLVQPIESTPMESDDSLKSDNVPMKTEQANEERSASPQYSIQEDKPPSPHRSEFMLALPERNELPEIKRSLSQDIFKKLQSDMDSDGESDDSQKLSLVVDENTNNSEDFKKEDIPIERAESNDVLPHESNDVLPHESNDVLPHESKDILPHESNDVLPHESNDVLPPENIKNDPNEIPLASEDVAAMALTLDDKIENVPIEAVVKECVRTSCMSCNYCRHAVKIAVNGKQLALHLLSEHRYTPVKNETNDDVIRKLKSSLDTLQAMHFNAETYDSSDPSIHVPYDKESNFDCFQCSYVSASHKDLYTHKRKFHTKSLLLCIMCKKNFFSYSELICHICTGTYCADPQVYSVDINFRCCFCRLDTIPSAFRLMVHLRKSHHTCDICLEICTDQQKLSTHMWKHKLNHLCYRCGIAYASKPDITKHLFWKHGTESVLCKKCLQKKWPHVYHFCIPPTSFICEECNTSFSKAVALKVHKRIHGNDYPYSCPQCEKKFVSKKLISRHIDRHNAVFQKKDLANKSPDDNKDEIINVTDVDNKDGFHNENSDSNKEGDIKDKSHKKHKKEKDKKDKKVVDVYDLPPLNLSSDSDSSDEEGPQQSLSKGPSDNGTGASDPSKIGTLLSDMSKAPDMPKLDGMLDGDEKSTDTSNFLNLLKQDESGDELSERKPTASEPVSPFDSSVVNSLLPMGKDEIKNDPLDSMQNDQSFMNWESFYKTNSLNSNLPFPLCAMKSEVAYSIIMGDHDYCQQCKTDPIIKEEWPSTSNQHLSDDKLEEVTPLISEKSQTPPPVIKEGESASTPSKKKLKSPKKKVNKTPEDKNSSSSSDSSSDSDTSCSCATNCSCTSSSDSSSSSSSDSDSSTNDDKKDKKRKKKDKKLPVKLEKESEINKEKPQAEQDEICPIPVPEDPPIRESELETDESTSDEEFYDRQPQIIANQLLAEKREKQINLSTPVNNGSASPLPVTPIPQQLTPTPPPTPVQPLLPQILPQPVAQENIPPLEQLVETPKLKPRAKRKRRVATSRTPKIDKPLPEPSFPKFSKEPKQSPFGLFQHTPPARHKIATPILGRSPSLLEAGGSGSETDSTRLSKRRRVPNKFYGYSSGEEEEKLQLQQQQQQQQQQHQHHTPKWRKIEMPIITHHTPKLPPTIVHPPPTPRIQLTVPKHIIRKPYQKQTPKQKMQPHHHRPPSSDSTDSGSDIDDRVPRPPSPMEAPKAEKDVYCYCRCPYDEVSEMIACDDTNCKIEWFHFECVGILVPPRGQWYCPDCRKARGLPT